MYIKKEQEGEGVKVRAAPSSGMFCPQPDPDQGEGLQKRWHSNLPKGLHLTPTNRFALFQAWEWCFPGGTSCKESIANAGDIDMQFQSLGWEDLLEKGMAIHSSIPAWRILMDRGAWQVTGYGVCKELDMTK